MKKYNAKLAKLDIQNHLSFIKEEFKVIYSLLSSQDTLPSNTFRTTKLMIIPYLYALWEKSFVLGISVCLKLFRNKYRKVESAHLELKALWMLEEPFYQSYKDTIYHAKKKRVYDIVEEFIKEQDAWRGKKYRENVDAEKLVFTLSNIKVRVLLLNAKCVQIDKLKSFQKLDLSRLDEFVEKRNDISHGGLQPKMGTSELKGLAEYVEELCNGFMKVISFKVGRI